MLEEQNLDIQMEVEISAQEQFNSTPDSFSPVLYHREETLEDSEHSDDDGPATLASGPNSFDDRRTFREELNIHKHYSIWGVTYGGEVASKTTDNIIRFQQEILRQNFFIPLRQCIPVINLNNRTIPIPDLGWGDKEEVWQNMLRKDHEIFNKRCNRLSENSNNSFPIFRAVLLDWLMEVSYTYQLKRQTFYLAVDFIDRFLTIKPSVTKSSLQLLGITSLFIAGKVEERNSPKVPIYAALCAGACNEKDILSCERLLLNTLGWETNLMTPPEWVNLFLQIYYSSMIVGDPDIHRGSNFMDPLYSGHQYIHIMYLIDNFALDPGFMQFRYSIIAAAAVYFCLGADEAQQVSGFPWEEIRDCVDYMCVYFEALLTSNEPRHRFTVPCSSCNYCLSVIETCKELKDTDVKLIMSETFSLQTYASSIKHMEKAIWNRLGRMGYNAHQVPQAGKDTQYTRLYAVKKVPGFLEDAGSIFYCDYNNIFSDELITLPEILKRVTDCANRGLITVRDI